MLKELRAEKKMTQVELAKKAKVTQAYIAMLESGEKKNPSLVIVRRIARALGVPISQLLE